MNKPEHVCGRDCDYDADRGCPIGDAECFPEQADGERGNHGLTDKQIGEMIRSAQIELMALPPLRNPWEHRDGIR